MFKHLLLPTDGSPLARVTGLHVSPRFQVLTYRPDMLEEARAEYERDAKTRADRYRQRDPARADAFKHPGARVPLRPRRAVACS